jgi:glyoxylase-like metal-dependent hydrolase (beta-lactamase superfamily II)
MCTCCVPATAITLAGRRCEILHAPGHAEGQIIFYAPAERLLLCGDHVLQRITPNIGYWPLSQPNPLGRYLASLRSLLALDVALALPGHHGAITDWRGRLHELLAHHDDRLEVAFNAAAKAPPRWRPATASSTSTASARTKSASPSPKRWRTWSTWSDAGRLAAL